MILDNVSNGLNPKKKKVIKSQADFLVSVSLSHPDDLLYKGNHEVN